MGAATATTAPVAERPEARHYSRIKRWLGVADFLLGLAFLAVLLATGWSGSLRDLSYHATNQNYSLAVLLYVVMLMALGRLVGFGLDWYSFRVEHQFHLSNQRLRSWLWDETKSFLVGVILAA